MKLTGALIGALVWLVSACGNDAVAPEPPAPGTATITAAGGTLTSADGQVTLVFPAGAVSTPVEVKITSSSKPADARQVPGSAYHFEPTGTQFNQPVVVTIKHGPLPAEFTTSKAFVWLHKWIGDAWLPIPGAGPDTVLGAVTGQLTSFSDYSALISDLAADIQALQVTLNRLLSDPIARDAIDFLAQLDTLLSQQTNPLFQALVPTVVDAMFATACNAYKNAIDVARNTTVDDYHLLTRLLGVASMWLAVTEDMRENACQAVIDLDELYSQKIAQFTTFYAARLAKPDFTTDFKRLIGELHLVQTLRGDMQRLKLHDLHDRLVDEVQLPLLAKLRPSAYLACRRDAIHEYLRVLLGLSQLFDKSPFSDDDIYDDLQYCATNLGWRLTESNGTQVGQGTLGGDSVPGAVLQTSSVPGARSGTLELSHDVRTFRTDSCVFTSDELIITFGGVEVRRLQPAADGNFFATPVSLSVQQLLAAASVDPDAPGTHRVEILRESSGCKGIFLQAIDPNFMLAALDLVYPAAPPVPDIDGVWTLDVDGACHGPLTFKQQGSSFTASGSIDGLFCPYSTSGSGTGSLNGQAITAGIAFNGVGQVTFKGTVAADGKSMSGTYDGPAGSGNWKATR